MNYKILINGDAALSVVFEGGISNESFLNVSRLRDSINSAEINGINYLIPSYNALLISYDFMIISADNLKALVKEILFQTTEGKSEVRKARVVHLPVCYGGEYGMDIETVATHNSLTVEEVIAIHSSVDYPVYMLGFTPGFPYLGGMDKKIATPRLASPRLKLEAGSVGIAGEQTGIYPIVSPGGWQIIGNTPIKLYDPNSDTPILLKAGDYLRFIPISSDEYDKISKEIEDGSYNAQFSEKEVSA